MAAAEVPPPGGASTARRRLARIAQLLEDEFGVPKRGKKGDPLSGLIRTILSQNTTDVNSRRAYVNLRERFSDWGCVKSAQPRSVEAAIRSGGLARTKAARIRRILADVERSRGSLDLGFLRGMSNDEVYDYLTALDGVGLKTAACVALFNLGRDVMPVDTHVHRVVGRLGVVGHPRTRDATFEALRPFVPAGKGFSLHVNTIRLGKEYCRPRVPDCRSCPVRRFCEHARGATPG